MGLQYLAFLLLALIWGSNFVFMKWAAEFITPMQIVFLRVAAGCLPILILALVKGSIRRDHFRHWPHFLVMSILGTSFYYWCFVKGTAMLPSNIAGMVSGAIPFCATAVTLVCVTSEAVTPKKIWGIAVGFAGVACMARPWEAGAVNMAGVAWILVGCLSLGTSFAYTRKYLTPQGIPALALSAYQMTLALAAMLLVTDYTGITAITQSPKALWGCLLGMGLLGTGIAFALYYYIVAGLGAVTASSVSYLAPVVAFFLGWFIMDDPVHGTDFLAMAFIFSGIILLRETPEKEQRTPPQRSGMSRTGNLCPQSSTKD